MTREETFQWALIPKIIFNANSVFFLDEATVLSDLDLNYTYYKDPQLLVNKHVLW